VRCDGVGSERGEKVVENRSPSVTSCVFELCVRMSDPVTFKFLSLQNTFDFVLRDSKSEVFLFSETQQRFTFLLSAYVPVSLLQVLSSSYTTRRSEKDAKS